MRVYQLTSLGETTASAIVPNPSPAMRILYYLRRHGGSTTDDQIKLYSGIGNHDVAVLLQQLVNRHMVEKVS